jgi:cob(I)alamin adenosyltransferase
MKIYTKTGDDGTTGLFGAGRIPKYALRIEAYGTVDEVNAFVGLCRTEPDARHFEPLLEDLQRLLFVLGADLATPLEVRSKYPIPRIEEHDILPLEQAIDHFEIDLPLLEKFILPGGSRLSAYFHLARTITRRAERIVVDLASKEEIGKFDIMFLNRLSDLFFVLSRKANQLAGVRDVEWDGKK